MPYHDCSVLEQPEFYRDENESPDVKCVSFDSTYQGLENASMLDMLGSVKMHLLLL